MFIILKVLVKDMIMSKSYLMSFEYLLEIMHTMSHSGFDAVKDFLSFLTMGLSLDEIELTLTYVL